MGYREQVGEWLDETNADRRLVLLFIVLVLVIFGSGLGTLILNLGPNGGPPVTTETEAPTPTGTETDSPTPDDGGAGVPTPTPAPPSSETETPVDTPTPTTTATETPDDGNDDTPVPTGNLVFIGSQQILSVNDTAPGESGTGTIVFESNSDESAELRITNVAITDEENGLTDPESGVDSTPNDGELSNHLEVRISFEDEAGNVNYLLGTDSGYERLSDLPGRTPSNAHPLDDDEQMIVHTDWRLPTSTGNEVQSDAVSFDVTFELNST